jgi:hypothetical protein
MKITLSAPAAVGAGALLCAIFLAGCGRPRAPQPLAQDESSGPAASPRGPSPAEVPDPLAVARSPGAVAVVAEQAQAARDVEDNARSRVLADQLLAHPDWLAHQEAICGPADATLQARYAALKGPPSEELSALKVACMAKDIAEREGRAPGSSGGVKNTGSL